MIIENGLKFKALSVDHKPNNPREFERINKNGGKVYMDNGTDVITKEDLSKTTVIKTAQEFDKYCEDKEIIYRAFPCGLSVSRTIGDLGNKIKDLGGIPGIIENTPEIFIMDNNSSNDFILMGCDGIFDNLSNAEIIEAAWLPMKKLAKSKKYDIHDLTKDMCDIVIKRAMEKQSYDNLSCIIIGLEGLEKYLNHKQTKDKLNEQLNKNRKMSC